MAVKTFKGGGHIPHFKSFSEGKPIEQLSCPKEVVIPMVQHIGAPCKPIVKVGDQVRVGQEIGESGGFVSAPIHASVAGKVIAIEPRIHGGGKEINSVVIEVDPTAPQFEVPEVRADLSQMSAQEIVVCIRDAGIVGMGGAGFPTHVKLSPPDDKPIDTVILNGAECEPFLTADHRYMLERADDMIIGLRALMKAVSAKQGYIGIEDNKPDAIAKLVELVASMDNVEVVALETKYPQGGEKQLITALTGKEVPSGGLPMDVGVIVQNVGTAVAVAEALQKGLPLIERVVTVTGPNVPKSGNYLIKVGTPLRHVLQACGVDGLDGGKVIMGGPMTGTAQGDLDAVVVKTTSGIVVMPKDMVAPAYKSEHCIRCGKCVEQCPMYLYPNQISIFAEADMVKEMAQWDIVDCIECSLCSYVCPSKRPIVEMIKLAKPKVWALQEKS